MQGLATGLPEVDEEHLAQLELVEAIRMAVTGHRDRTQVTELMLELEEATSVHFVSEELLMSLHGWHRFEPHAREHRRLLTDLRALRDDFERGAAAEMMVELDQLQSWLANHVMGMDRAFAQDMLHRGPPSAA